MTSKRNRRPFFVVSTARSGSTSLCRILDQAANGVCAMEPMPNLNVESRDFMDGLRRDALAVVDESIVPRVRAGQQTCGVYGEKNVTYAPFIPALYERLDCRFVFLIRDGREVVRSLIDWHNLKFGSIYRECRDPGTLNEIAKAAVRQLPAWADTSDYSRPRPRGNEPYADLWADFTRLEMCAYYWSRINELYLAQLTKLPASSWIMLDYTRPEPSQIERVVEFLELEGLDYETVRAMLDARINSLRDRGVTTAEGDKKAFWMQWESNEKLAFDEIAGETMRRLGYYPPADPDDTRRAEIDSAGFGSFWRRFHGGISWYSWMYDYRAVQHEAFRAWFAAQDAAAHFESIMEIGCGLAVGYADFFRDRRYIGVDLTPHLIAWCERHRSRANHRYVVADVTSTAFGEHADLVFSQGTIDNVPDMDEYLRAMVRAARKWIYVTAYRGHFPALDAHVVRFSEAEGIYYNDISPACVTRVLEEMGCTDIHVGPLATGRAEIEFETVIIARVDGR